MGEGCDVLLENIVLNPAGKTPQGLYSLQVASARGGKYC